VPSGRALALSFAAYVAEIVGEIRERQALLPESQGPFMEIQQQKCRLDYSR